MRKKWKFFLLAMILSVTYVNAQEITVKGTVKDESGGVLPGVNIQVKGTDKGTSTDFDGNFEINTMQGKVLVFTYVGFSTKEVVVNNLEINVVLVEGAQSLDEVIIVGSTIRQERKKLGNAITTVKSSELLKAEPVGTISALQGKIPGAQITQNSGDPAGGFSVRLRGPSTILGSSEPLYVVDGVVVSNLTIGVTSIHQSAGEASPGQNRMVDINPNDISDINILNGSAAGAIYGSRASNGVVIITTKKGGNFSDGPEFSFKTTFNVNKLRKKVHVNLQPEEFVTIPNSSLTGRLWPIFGWDPVQGFAPFRYLNPNKIDVKRYDYQDEVFQTGIGTDNYFSMKGGNDKMNYMASVGYLLNEGIIRNTKYKRFTARVNFGHQVADWISYDVGLYFSNSNADEKPDGNTFYSPINSMNITNNTFDITQRDANGDLQHVELSRVNPLSIIETFDITQKVTRFIPNLHVKINPIENLTIDQVIAADTYTQEGNMFFPELPYADVVNPAFYNRGYKGNSKAEAFNWNYDINATYDWNITDKIESQTIIGYNFQSSKIELKGEHGRDLDASGNPTVPLQFFPVDSKLDMYGFFLQETVSFNDKLFVTLAGRVDGSTNYSVDNRTNFYPKASASYMISNEDFWNEDSFFNLFRLRASYGQSGNISSISPFARFGKYNSFDFMGSQTSLQQSSALGNEDLKVERTNEFEIGFDLNFWNDRVGLLFTYYNQDIEDLTVNRTLAPSIGGTARIENVGSMENNGVEIYARITPVKTKDFNWDLFFNYGSNKNKVIKTIGGDIIVSSSFAGDAIRIIEGQPLGVFFGTYAATNSDGSLLLTNSDGGVGNPVGVPQAERGDLATGEPMRDANGQPTGDILKKLIGDPNPDYILGFGTNFSYKNFSFYMLWEAVQGFDVWDADYRTRQGVGLGAEAEGELTGLYPRGWVVGNHYKFVETRIIDGSFVKLREVTMSYTFPSIFNDHVNDFRISLIGRNLVSFDDFTSYDPEVNAGGQSNVLRSGNFGTVPIPQSFAISLSANF